MNSRSGLSRRRLLQVTGAGVAVALAGCSGGSDDNDDQDGSNADDQNDGDTDEVVEYDSPDQMSLAGSGATVFSNWLLPGYEESTRQGTLLGQFENFQALSGGSANRVANQREVMASYLGTEPASIDWALGVGSAPSGQLGWIYSGSFDQDAVAEFLAEEQDVFYVGPLDGYEILESDGEAAIAVGSETIIEHPSYNEFIEAENGNRETLAEADESAALALETLPSGLRIALSRRTDHDDLDVLATSYQGYQGDQPTERVGTFVFADAASATLENARSVLSSGDLDPDIQTAEVAGRVLMLQYSA